MPHEVWWAWCIQEQGFCGSNTMRELNRIIDEYPEYFPWEHKYKEIPKSVHDAFSRECYPKQFEPIKWEENNDGKGMWGVVKNTKSVDVVIKDNEQLSDILKGFSENMKKRDQKRIANEKRIKKIWDKHYRKFGLECREF